MNEVQAEVMVRVMAHWAKHSMAEVTRHPVRTIDGALEEFGDPKLCDVCTAVTIGQAYPVPSDLIVAADNMFESLKAEARKRGLL